MKTLLLAMLTFISLLMSCSSGDPKPVVQIWSQGCAELFPDKDIYRLSGQCCHDIEFPRLDLSSGQRFSAQATKHTYGRSGNRSETVTLQGEVSRDGGTLTLTYGQTIFTLKPGHATMACDCFCP